MPKDSFTPKAIGNRMKAKGLQKLKFYCQMCQKQCRDDNGFKCHCLSEAHQRQMAIFADNPDRFLDIFSETFEAGFLELLQRRFNTRRIPANHVYNEYIQDKEHVHMNSTIWPTLTDFVKYLGRTAKCVIDETERGWHVTWINRDPEALRRAAAAAERTEVELDDLARHEAELEARAAAARAAALAELFRDDGDDDGDDGNGGGGGGGESSSSASDAGAVGSGNGATGNASTAAQAAFATPAYTALLRVAHASAPVRLQLASAPPSSALLQLQPAAPSVAPAGSGAHASGGALPPSGPAVYVAPLGAAVALQAPAAGSKRRRFDVAEDDDEGGSSSSSSSSCGSSGPRSAAASSSVAPSGMSAAARLMQEDLRLRSQAAVGVGGKPSRFAAAAGEQQQTPHPPPPQSGPGHNAAAAAALAPPPRHSSSTAAAGGPCVPMPAATDCWLVPGLVVKVLNATVGGGAFYKAKAAVAAIAPEGGGYVGVLRLLDGSGAVLKVDQAQLETVLPAPGGGVLVLGGPARGRLGTLLRIDEAAFCAVVRLAATGEALPGLEYEAVCKWEGPAAT